MLVKRVTRVRSEHLLIQTSSSFSAKSPVDRQKNKHSVRQMQHADNVNKMRKPKQDSLNWYGMVLHENELLHDNSHCD